MTDFSYPRAPTPLALEMARAIVGRRFMADHKDYNRMLSELREQGLDHRLAFYGPNSAEARAVVSFVADENLAVAPITALQRKLAKLQGEVASSVAASHAKFDPTRLGGSGAAGRQRDRARAGEQRNIIRMLADRLEEELKRRAAGQPSAPSSS